MKDYELIALARRVLRDHEEDWMPEGEEWEAIVKDFAEHLDGTISDLVLDWLVDQERERAERDMAAAEAVR
jgi:hypothetical protein